MPIFIFEGAKVRDLFVLGDIHGLISRLKGQRPANSRPPANPIEKE
jgi:hypothetical protein